MNLGIFNYVLGFRSGILNGEVRQYSHAWLQNDKNIIADITADQFEEIEEKIIVTTDNKWHSTFRSEIKHIAHFNIYDKSTYFKLEKTYEEICKNINAM